MRLIGIDYGTKRIGIAVSDALGITVTPLTVIKRKTEAQDIEEIRKIVLEKEAERIVIGLPLNMNGTPGILTGEIEAFAAKLKVATGVEIDYCDERLTSHEAEGFLIHKANMSREKRKEVKDKIAAYLILQTYLEKNKP
jgi:putative Holliday junction resolvase